MMNQEQVDKLKGTAASAKAKLASLWKSGAKGKTIIIVGALIMLGLIGQLFSGSETTPAADSQRQNSESTSSKEKSESDELGIDESLLKGSSMDTAQPNNDLVKVKKGRSIMTRVVDKEKWGKEYNDIYHKFRDKMGGDSSRKLFEELYQDFFSPMTHEQAKIDATKPRFQLFGGTLKIGDEIDVPSSVDTDEVGYEFRTQYMDQEVAFNRSSGILNHFNGKYRFQDGSELWNMVYNVKEFMGLSRAETTWFRDVNSNKLVLFYVEVKNRNAGNSNDAQETRDRLIAATKKKFPDMRHSFHDIITDEYTMNGDILLVMQSPKMFLDSPFVKVSVITPSIVAKILKKIDDEIKSEYETYKQKDANQLDGF